MEKTLNKVTTKIRERILELNVKLKVQGLTQFSFELNKHGYLVLTEQPSNSNPTLAVLTEFDEEQALDWLSKHESFHSFVQTFNGLFRYRLLRKTYYKKYCVSSW